MKYDFDTIVDRRGTNCLKYDFAAERGMPKDVLPLWVADMDFPTVPAVSRRLEEAARHGIFGYSDGKEEYFQAVSGWYQKRFGWETKREWLAVTPGVVFAIAAAVRAFTEKGDAVLIQQPVYHPFGQVIRQNDRKLVNSPLKLNDSRYEMDFEDFEKKIVENQVKLFILCSPHNPVGRVWEEWELKRAGEICLRHGVLVVSDEIHCDFVYPGHVHRVFASLSPQLADITVTCTAPSKTFNLAGLQASNIFIPNPDLRARFKKELAAVAYGELNLMGLLACQTAYEEGEEWLDQLLEYLKDSVDFVGNFLKEKLPGIRLIEPEGTYLLWFDLRGLGLSEEEEKDLIVNRAKLWLNDGKMFGSEGRGFWRVNIGCPRLVLGQAMERLERAVSETL